MRIIPLPPGLPPEFQAWARAVQTPPGVASVTAAYQASVTDGLVKADAGAGAFAVTLPPASDQPCAEITVKRMNGGGNAVTVTAFPGDTIDGAPTYALALQFQSATVKSDGANSWHIL